MTQPSSSAPDGDARRFERDTLSFLPDVARFARALTRDADEASDLVQETYLCAFRARESFLAGSDARRWLFTICRHEFLRVRKREGRTATFGDEAELEALATAGLHVAAKRDGYEEVFAAPDLGPAIVQAMRALPEIHRVVVALVDVEGLDYAEAAAALGLPIGTIRSRLFRARRMLQEALIEHARDAGLVPSLRSPSPRVVGQDVTR